MINKISNDDVFKNYVGKYIKLTENGVTKKYLVGEIDKNSLLRDVSIQQGVSGTDYSFTSASILQRCFICDNPCASAVPIIELFFPGKGSGNAEYGDVPYYTRLTYPYFNENHVPVINNHRIGTISLSVLSADYNIVWLIPSNESYNINRDNVFSDWRLRYPPPSPFYSKTTAFQVLYYDPAYYYTNDWNTFRIDHTYAYNPLNAGFPSGEPVDYGDGTNWFWGNFYNSSRANSRIIYKQKEQIGDTTSITCTGWKLYDLTESEVGLFGSSVWYGGEYAPPFNTYELTQTYSYSQQVTSVFLDLNPCSPPVVNIYQYDINDYYRHESNNGLTNTAYINYSRPFYPAPMLRKLNVYTQCNYSQATAIYVGIDKSLRTGDPISTAYYYDSGGVNIIDYNFIYYNDSSGTIREYTVYYGNLQDYRFC
jgi:hypothetical protein